MIPSAGTLYCADETGAAQLAQVAEGKNTALNRVACTARQDQAPALARALTGSLFGEEAGQKELEAPAASGPRWLDLPGGAVPVRFLDLMSAQ